MNLQAYAIFALMGMIAMAVGLMVFAAMRLASAARRNRLQSREAGESALMTVALQDAIQKLRAQERAMTERAEASEHLNTQIVNSLSAGLLVVDRSGQVQILNPVGRRMLGVEATGEWPHYTGLPVAAAPLAGVIEECLATGQPIVRRALEEAVREGQRPGMPPPTSNIGGAERALAGSSWSIRCCASWR